MSLKQLHACITDLFIEWHKEHPNDPYLHRLHSKLQILLDSYVCIPRKKLQEKIDSCPDCSIQVHLGRVCPKHKWIKELLEVEKTK